METDARPEHEEQAVLGAGVRQFGGPVEVLELPGPRGLRPDEVLIDVQACGVGNWDEFARTGGWDLGVRPPMALGVEAAGLVAAVGDRVTGIAAGDRVTVHSAPLREQGTWAGRTSPPPHKWPSCRRECPSTPPRRCRSLRSPPTR
ncbi:MAG: alcohol dehydrogenase catalytic domain-containing protein [Trebonia sp.]